MCRWVAFFIHVNGTCVFKRFYKYKNSNNPKPNLHVGSSEGSTWIIIKRKVYLMGGWVGGWVGGWAVNPIQIIQS